MKIKNRVFLALLSILILAVPLGSLLKTPEAYSASERRPLAAFPKISWETFASGKFMEDFEAFSADQFPIRDRFRTLRAAVSQKIFGQKDYHGIYEKDGYLSKIEYPYRPELLSKAGEVIQSVYETYLKETDCRLFLSIIPDKNYFLASSGGYPVMDYTAAVQDMRKICDFAEYIDIFPSLTLEDFYKTDQHWRQECLSEPVKLLAEGMEIPLDTNYNENILTSPFYGTYCGQSAFSYPPDEIHYLSSETFSSCKVTSFDTGKPQEGKIYDMEKAKGRDAYEMFLMGANALTVIENPKAKTNRELILFRDSFGSSLAPLLINSYAKITLVDLRYIPAGLLGHFIDFKNQDVLFLYSTLILNNGSVLKK